MEIGRSYTRPRHANHRAGSQAAAALAALLAVFGIMAAGYVSSLNRITLVLDGQPRIIQTNQTTVEGALRDAGLSLYPEDRVQPATDRPLTTNATIQIDRARPVSILVDGQSVRVRTHAATLVELLAEQRITLHSNDALSIDGDPAMTQSILAGAPTTPHTVTVRRAVPFTVQFDDGTSQALRTARSPRNPNTGYSRFRMIDS